MNRNMSSIPRAAVFAFLSSLLVAGPGCVEEGDEISEDEPAGAEDDSIPYTNYSCSATAKVYVGNALQNTTEHTYYNTSWCGNDGWLGIMAYWECEMACGCNRDASNVCFVSYYRGPWDGSWFVYKGVRSISCENICAH